MNFKGYVRQNGTIGIRNHLLIFPTVLCASSVSQKIKEQIPGSVCVTHPYGCGHLGRDKDQILRTMIGFAGNPNVGGVLLVGLGCELISPEMVAEGLKAKNISNIAVLGVQQEGGTAKAVERGIELAYGLKSKMADLDKVDCDISNLTVGVHNSASDALSGLTANPAVGHALDLIVAKGGRCIVSDIAELIGAENILAEKAVSEQVRNNLFTMIENVEKRVKMMGVDIRGCEPSPGNINGGLSTIEEKALGSVWKLGSTKIQQVIEYAEMPDQQGLIVMDSPSFHVISSVGMLASGAHMVVFTTGRGTTLGLPIAPVIKVCSNSATYSRLKENIDINAGVIIDENVPVDQVGTHIFEEIVAVASGKRTRAEILGHSEFALYCAAPPP